MSQLPGSLRVRPMRSLGPEPGLLPAAAGGASERGVPSGFLTPNGYMGGENDSKPVNQW